MRTQSRPNVAKRWTHEEGCSFKGLKKVKGEKRVTPTCKCPTHWVCEGYYAIAEKGQVPEKFSFRKDTKAEADALADEMQKTRQQPGGPLTTKKSNVTFAEFVEKTWLPRQKTKREERTMEGYEMLLRVHILPHWGHIRLVNITPEMVTDYLTAKLNGSTATLPNGKQDVSQRPGTVINHHSLLSGVFRLAKRNKIIRENPAHEVKGEMELAKLATKEKTDKKSEGILKAFTHAQLWKFFDTAREVWPQHFLKFLLMGLAGLRVGDALTFRWNYIDFEKERLKFIPKKTRKTGIEADVKMPLALKTVLLALRRKQQEAALKAGQPMSSYLFLKEALPSKKIAGMSRNLLQAVESVLKAAKLPDHHNNHSLRHSYASILIANGYPIIAVQRALGHKKVETTVGEYGSWLPSEQDFDPNAPRFTVHDLYRLDGPRPYESEGQKLAQG